MPISSCEMSLRQDHPSTTNQPNLSFGRNRNEPRRLGSSLIDSVSFKSLKHSMDLHRTSPKYTSNYFANVNYHQLSSGSKYALNSDIHNCNNRANMGSAAVHINSDMFSPRNLPKSPSSFISSKSSSGLFESSPDGMGHYANLRTSKTSETPQSPPDVVSSENILPISNKPFRKPQHSPSHDECVESSFSSSLTILPVTTSPSKLSSRNGYVSMYLQGVLTHSTRQPRRAIYTEEPILPGPSLGCASAEFDADSCETVSTSVGSSTGTFETALTSDQPYTPVAENNSDMSDPHATLNGNVGILQYAAKPLNLSTRANISQSLPQRQQAIDVRMEAPDSQSPHCSDSHFSPLFGIQKSSLTKDPVHGGFLHTPAIHTAVNEAVALYESIQRDKPLSLSKVSSNPFSHHSPQTLAHKYAMIIDARNAIILRQSAIVADIGLYLELLVPKINLYATDTAHLVSICQDLDYIHQECANQKIELQFHDLEWSRFVGHSAGLSFTDDNRHQDFCWLETTMLINTYSSARAIGLQFLDDPTALIENRLPKLGPHM